MGKRAITVIITIFIIIKTLLAITIETIAIPGTRSNQINLLKDIGNILNFKVRFYNDVIIIKKSDDIDIIVLNDKAAMLETTILETL